MTTLEAAGLIGREIQHDFNGLMVRVRINDVKTAWGRMRILVSVCGQESNQVWIEREVR